MAFPEVIDRDVVRDLEQPARKLEFRAIAVEMVQDLNERVLRQILRCLPVADHAEDEREDRALIPANEFPIRGFPPLLGESNHVSVGKVRKVEEWTHQGGKSRLSPGAAGAGKLYISPNVRD